MNNEKLLTALKEIGEPPCTGCKFANACAAGLACKDYGTWVSSGSMPKKLKEENRTPKVSIYQKIFEGKKLHRKTAPLYATA